MGDEILLKKEIYYLKIFLSITVLLDALNGFITMYLPGILEELVPLIRLGAIMLFIYLIFKVNKEYFRYVVAVGVLWIINILIRCLLNENLNIASLFIEVVYVSRIFYFFSLLLLFISLSNKKLIDLNWMKDIVKRNAYFIVSLILLPTILGLGRQTYAGSGFGNSGFFIANNSTNIVLIVCSLFLLYLYLFEKKQDKVLLSFFIMSIIALWVQGSKTSLFFVIVGLLLFISILIRDNFSKIKKLKNTTIIMTSVFFFIFIFLFNNQLFSFGKEAFETINQLIIRQKHLASLNEGIFNVLLSGRLTFLSDVIGTLSGKSIFFYIIGFGTSNLPAGAIVEMDIIDLLIREGLLGLLVTYGVSTYCIINNYMKKNEYTNFTIFSNIILFIMIGYSIFAGHVYIDIMSSSFMAFFLFLSLKSSNDIEEILV